MYVCVCVCEDTKYTHIFVKIYLFLQNNIKYINGGDTSKILDTSEKEIELKFGKTKINKNKNKKKTWGPYIMTPC